jgi:hypothetical protein
METTRKTISFHSEKTEKVHGNETLYFTEVNGTLLNESLSFDKELAFNYYRDVVANGGRLITKTKIKEVQI